MPIMATRASLSQKPAKGAPQPSAGSYQAWSGKGMATPRVTRRQALDDDNSEQRRGFSHPSRATASRAAPCSSHSSGTESGRERRRKGKLKMQEQIRSLRLQVDDLQAQVIFYRALVDELAPQAPGGEAVASPAPVIFDIFDDVMTTDMGSQTDISVRLDYPDVFVRIPQSLTPCEVEHAAEHDAVNANAEAVASASTRLCAAGAALAHSLTPCEVEHAADKHAVNANADAAVVPASTSLCAADAAAGGCGSDFSSPTLANTLLAHASPRALDAISECVPRDFNSQDLANRLQCGPSASRHQHCSHASPRAFDATAEDVPHDFNSQDLANMPQSGPSAFTQLRTADMPCETAGLVSSPTPPILAETGVGSPRTTPSTPGSSSPGSSSCAAKDFISQNLAKTVELLPPRAVDAISEGAPHEFHSQDLANRLQCGPSASLQKQCSHASPGAFDAISDGVQNDFNSQDLANLPQNGPSAFTQLRTADLPCETAGLVSSPAPPILAVIGVGSPRTTPSTPGSSNPGSSSCAAKDFDSQNLAKPVELLVDGTYRAPGGEGTSVTTPGMSACTSTTSQVSALDDVIPRAMEGFVSKNVCKKGTASRVTFSDEQQCGRNATAHRNNTATELFDAIADIDDPPEHRTRIASPELFDAINEQFQTPLAAAAGSPQAIGDSIAALEARIAALQPLVEDQQLSQQELRIRYEKQQRELKAQRRKGKGKGKGSRS